MAPRCIALGGAFFALSLLLLGCSQTPPEPTVVTATATAPAAPPASQSPSTSSIYDQARSSAQQACALIVEFDAGYPNKTPEQIPDIRMSWDDEIMPLLHAASRSDPLYEELSNTVTAMWMNAGDWRPYDETPKRDQADMLQLTKLTVDQYDEVLETCARLFRNPSP